jgi:hypothetical protein
MPSNFAPTFSLLPWLYDYSLHSVTAILTTKIFVSMSPPDSRKRKRSRKPGCMLRMCHSALKTNKTWPCLLIISNCQTNSTVATAESCKHASNTTLSKLALRLGEILARLRNIGSARSMVQPSKCQEDWLPCTFKRRMLMNRYSLTNTRSRKSVA